MSAAILSSTHVPMSEINTTPLIDVLLVLLIVFVMLIPAATHSLEVPLPGDVVDFPEPDPNRNKVVLTAEGTILWNDNAVSQGQLLAVLRQTTRFPVEPELQFEPEANASYDLSAKVLNIIKGSGVTKFGFVGNEKYRVFGKA